MYSTCLFCHADLGRNEVIEAFPIGRRLAFDAATGRLWVVCQRCELWNLTPLEERWEAVEECERRFRGTRLRVSTENIGLARLAEGLELVRIGEPLRPELAAWRYGDRLGRRRRRRLLGAGLGLAAAGAVVAVGNALSLGVGLFGSLVYGLGRDALRGNPREILVRVPREGAPPVEILRRHLPLLHIGRTSGGEGWALGFQERYSRFWLRTDDVDRGLQLEGVEARRVAAAVLPAMNQFGAGRGAVRDAVRLIEGAPEPDDLAALVERTHRWATRLYVQDLPAYLRVALEMALYEGVERRAMEGELAELERAWRDAEEIAKIADDLLLPDTVVRRVPPSSP